MAELVDIAADVSMLDPAVAEPVGIVADGGMLDTAVTEVVDIVTDGGMLDMAVAELVGIVTDAGMLDTAVSTGAVHGVDGTGERVTMSGVDEACEQPLHMIVVLVAASTE